MSYVREFILIFTVGEIVQRILNRSAMIGSWDLSKDRRVLEKCPYQHRSAYGACSYFFFLGQGITNETVDLLDDGPGIISSTAKILRLWDDLGSAKVTYNLVMNLFLF